MFVGKNTQHHTDVIVTILSYKPDAVPIKIPPGYLRTQQSESEIYEEQKKPRIDKTLLKKTTQLGRHILPDPKSHFKAIVI